IVGAVKERRQPSCLFQGSEVAGIVIPRESKKLELAESTIANARKGILTGKNYVRMPIPVQVFHVQGRQPVNIVETIGRVSGRKILTREPVEATALFGQQSRHAPLRSRHSCFWPGIR